MIDRKKMFPLQKKSTNRKNADAFSHSPWVSCVTRDGKEGYHGITGEKPSGRLNNDNSVGGKLETVLRMSVAAGTC